MICCILCSGIHLVAQSQNQPELDVKSYDLHIDLTGLKKQKLSGMAEVTCAPSGTVFPQSVQLMLLKLKVDSVLLWHAGTQKFEPSAFTYNDTLLRILTPLTETRVFRIFYQGTPVKDLTWGGFYFSGEYAFNMGVGFSADPHPFGRVWFPCNEDFNDKALYEYRIKVPEGYAAICGGLFADTFDSGSGTITWHWKHKIPVSSYLASVAVAPYQILSGSHSGLNGAIPVTLAAMASDTGNLRKSFLNLGKAMQSFEYSYGAYPFERIGYSLVPFNAGAMEHACNIAYPVYAADGTLNNETLMAHELSHHWWGNNTTCSTPGDMWLNEGWASYSEALFIESVYGKKAYLDYIRNIHKPVLQFAHLRDGISTGVSNVSHANTYGTHVYRKGADMIHSIRTAMGDTAFFNACRQFMKKYAYQNVRTQDFIAHFNTYAGIPSQFIQQIIADTGFFHFSIYDIQVVRKNQWEVTLSYQQRKRFGHHVYTEMPYEITVFDKKRNRQVVPVKLGKNGTVVFQSAVEPEMVCFDFDQKMQDAITEDVIITDAPGIHPNAYSMLPLNITRNSDTSLIRIEHHWVYPDAYFLNLPGVLMSKARYWSVDGILDTSFRASATFNYDGSKPGNFNGGWLDHELLNGIPEDSIVLLYRPDAKSYWRIETNCTKTIGNKLDKKGSFLLPQLQKGQYAFGIFKSGMLNHKPIKSGTKDIRWYPNPADENLEVQWSDAVRPDAVRIMDLSGKNWLQKDSLPDSETLKVDTAHLPNGTYYLQIFSNGNTLLNDAFLISR